MSASVIPGPLGLQAAHRAVDAGTLTRTAQPLPGIGPATVIELRAQATAPSQAVYSVDKAVKYIDANAHATSQGKCATYVRKAIEAGGGVIPLPRPVDAKDYGPVLAKLGFAKIPAVTYAAQRGDIAVLQPPKGRVSGHIEMFNGSIWVSDFRQKADIYPGPAYRDQQVSYEIYRP